MYELYGYWRSQAAYRVRIALSLKGKEWREHLVDLLKGEQFAGPVAKHNPHHAVPVLIDGPRVLTQSFAILEYLEELFPDPPLLPADPYSRARVRAFALLPVADCHAMVVPRARKRLAEQFGANEQAIDSWIAYWQTLVLEALEVQLAARDVSSPFCFGDKPGLADICLAVHVAGCKNAGTPTEGFRLVSEVDRRCHQLEAFSANAPWVIREKSGAA